MEHGVYGDPLSSTQSHILSLNVLVTLIPSPELVLRFGLTEGRGGGVKIDDGDMGRTR